jgi:hypothetical protein
MIGGKMAMNKRGFVIELIAFIVIGINNELSSGKLDTSAANISDINSKSFSYLNTGMSNLKLISAIILIGYLIATMVMAYFSTKHPLWIFVYVLITILLVIFSITISNSYDTMKENPTINSMVSGFSISNVIIGYLPVWVAIIGLFGIVLSVVGSVVSRRLFEG